MEELTWCCATEQDSSEIFALYRTLANTLDCAWSEEYPGRGEITYDLSRNALFCLKAGERLVGTVSMDLDENVEALSCWSPVHRPSAELARLGVREGWQNQGIAKLLVRHLLEELRGRGFQSVHLLVSKTHPRAIRVYEQTGFARVGECELYGHQWWCYERQI
jgi:ribosomal protein S18 acetylase RimI-like enzyme